MTISWRVFVVAGLVAGVMVGVAPLAAQVAPDTDVGQMSEASFSRYVTAAECAWSAEWLENMFWRDRRPDTVYHTRMGNPYQPETQQTIQGCARRYPVAGVQERDLLGVAQAALADGQDEKADAAFARLMKFKATEPVSARAWAYHQAVDIYLEAAQPRIAEAERYIAKLDAMGADAAADRMLAHAELAREAQRRDSIPLWERETQAALTASQQVMGDARKVYADASAHVYTAMAQLRARQNDVAGARTTLTAGRAALIPLRPTVDSVFDNAEQWYTVQGRPVGPVEATQWANGGIGGTVHPVSGKPAVVAFVSVNCGAACYANYAVLRRLMAQYSPTTLDVIFVTTTEGRVRSRLVPPDSEMMATEDYFLNYLKFPVSLAMWHGVYHRRADGRPIVEMPPTWQAYQPPQDQDIVVAIIDKTGILRLYTTLGSQNEAMLDDVVRSVM